MKNTIKREQGPGKLEAIPSVSILREAKTTIIIAVLFACMVLAVQSAFALEENSNRRKNIYNYSIGVQPLYLASGGLRLDFETRLKDPGRVLQISAIGYLLPKRNDTYKYWESLLTESYYDVTKLTGAGLALDYKWFPFRNVNFLYFSGGISYQYFDVRYDGYEYISYREDGMTFYEPRWGEVKQVFHKTGANVCFGLQNKPNHRFLIDTYTGFGYAHSFYDEDKYHINDNMFNVGYRGCTFHLGVRFGCRF